MMMAHLRAWVDSDEGRIFVSALLVYLAFWNPWLQSSMTWNFLDAAVSFADTGRWEMAHAGLYEGKDTATTREGRLVSAEPPGMAVLVLPVYLTWRTLAGPAETAGDFQALNGLLAILIGATSAALVAAQVCWLAGWLGASRRSRIMTALLVAFGTPGFFFATGLFKEVVAACAVMTACRLALAPGPSWQRAAAGALAGMATAIVHSIAPLAVLLLGIIVTREGIMPGLGFVAGGAPFAAALGFYNTWLFGRPWLSGYYFVTGLPHMGFVMPKPAVLLDLLIGPSGGLFLYAPFLALAVLGLRPAWNRGRREEAAVAVLLLAGLWVAAAGWQSQFGDRASWAHTLGPRMLFPGIPLFASFAALAVDGVSRRLLLVLAAPSIVCGYLSAQAGFIPETNPFPYAVKTWLSGTGMAVLFKEALPVWSGMETVHTMISRPDVGLGDLGPLLQTADGRALMWHQAMFGAANLLVLAGIGRYLLRLWRPSLDCTGPP